MISGYVGTDVNKEKAQGCFLSKDITANCWCHLEWWVCLVVSDGGAVPGAAARARVTVMYRGAAGSRHHPAHMVFSCSPALLVTTETVCAMIIIPGVAVAECCVCSDCIADTATIFM